MQLSTHQYCEKLYIIFIITIQQGRFVRFVRANVLPLNVYQYEAMKKTILAKLKSDSGASLMAALLFFIMCATVGSIILAAATASSGRLAGLQRDEQAHYAVNSAASMFSEVIKDKKVMMRLTKTNVSDDYVLSFVDPNEDPYDLEKSLNPNGIMLPYLVSNIYTKATLDYSDIVPKSINSTPIPYSVTINVDGDDDLAVRATATMTSNLELLVEFTAVKSIGKPNAETIKVRFKPVVDTKEIIQQHEMNDTKGDSTSTDDGNRITTRIKVHTISWTNPVFE